MRKDIVREEKGLAFARTWSSVKIGKKMRVIRAGKSLISVK